MWDDVGSNPSQSRQSCSRSAKMIRTLATWGSPGDIDRAGGIDAVLDRLRLDGVTKEQPVSSLSGGEKAMWQMPTGM